MAQAVDVVGPKKIGSIDLSAPRMQGDFSVKTILSLTTAESKFFSERGEHSLIMSPSVKFGLFKNRRSHPALMPEGAKNPFTAKKDSSASAITAMLSPKGAV